MSRSTRNYGSQRCHPRVRADSVVELLSAAVVLLRFLPVPALSERKAARLAGGLLYVLAAVVLVAALESLVLGARARSSPAEIAISALAADAAQSATRAWPALTTLAGLAANTLFHIQWIDAVAALIAVPLLIREALTAWRGQSCSCC